MSANLNRREALQQIAALMGGTLSAPAVLGFLGGCTAKQDASWNPVFLTTEQAALVAAVVDLMIPRTDTPGALDVGVPGFIDTLLKDAYAKEDQQRFTAGLEEFEAQSQQQHGRAFLKLEPAQRMALVQSVHDAAVTEEKSKVGAGKFRRPFMLMTKEMALLGYFSSEVGVTRVLQYVRIPGEYHGCVPLSQAGNGKAWAFEASVRF